MINSILQTFTGKKFDFLNIREKDINIIDIAHSLSLLCTYNGHCKEFYSVAQHSLKVCSLVSNEYKYEALLHDAGEAYVGDFISPLLESFREIDEIKQEVELKVAQTLKTRFWNPSDEVKKADYIAFCNEAIYLSHVELYQKPQEILKNKIEGYFVEGQIYENPVLVEFDFLEKYLELKPNISDIELQEVRNRLSDINNEYMS